MASPSPPPPNGQVLSLVSALSQTANHDLHVQAIQARDQALNSSLESYGNLCLQLAFLLVGCDQPDTLLQRIEPSQLQIWQQTDAITAGQIQSNPSMWIPFGQMAGLILKNALLRPPIQPATNRPLFLEGEVAHHVKETLLYGLNLRHTPLRNVISSVIADCSVSHDSVQPNLHILQWPTLMPTLIQNLDPNNPNSNVYGLQASLSTVKKMMEDDPQEIPTSSLDALVPLVLNLFQSPDESTRMTSLQSLAACLSYGLVPSSLVVQFPTYLEGLSRLASDPSVTVRQWVCRSINTLLEFHAQYLQPQWPSICQFMLQCTIQQPQGDEEQLVATEACEFWLIFATIDEADLTSAMMDTIQSLLPQLIPTLLNNMVYSQEQRVDLEVQNELDMEEGDNVRDGMKPVFHKSRAKHGGGHDDGDDEDGDDDDDEFGEDNEWNLRKYAGASLDSLANLYGAEPILPNLLPSLEQGIASNDPWIQEASILALGAIAEGCREEMNVHMANLYPYLMNLLATPETPENLPQVKIICAWTISRYFVWAVDQVQTGSQGHLLAASLEVLLKRLQDKNRKVQVSIGSALSELMETAGDLMVPYLQEIYPVIVSAMGRYQGRSLVILFDTLGIMAEHCGPATGENDLPRQYVPPLLSIWNTAARHDPSNRMLLPLMESLATIAATCGMNFQPFALECLDTAMGTIEQVQMELMTTEDPALEEADPIICATDLLDGLCEGLGSNFAKLVGSSSRYGPNFLNVLHALCTHPMAGIRMSALALLGDLARNTPSMIEPALPTLLQDAIANLESTFDEEMHGSLCSNAVWAIGEICVQCGSNSAPIQPFAQDLMQKLVGILMGNGSERVSSVSGLAENASACVGRLATVNPAFVAPDLPRFLLGWCDGLSRITDVTERRDAFNGFCHALYANPQAIHQVDNVGIPHVITSILFAILTWHIPSDVPRDTDDFLSGSYGFTPFPPTEAELGQRLSQLIRHIRSSVGGHVWKKSQDRLPVNVRRLFREAYQIE
ncbi:heat repeat-containing protein [Nitzschia inconspicua]|uniref:Heat repeat-containing protein n=1 Tax=Nitzschia inconspicua TaxID=303405 RepID=A0A9K3PLE0_9STRA|nr:heat repeat-containing protein [Nitzschia inconspicua]